MSSPPLSRRAFVRATVASGAVLFARPTASLADLLGASAGSAATRVSRLDPGLRLVHADLHNHSLLSDGDGDAAEAFSSMRASGLDVAALTDHSGVGKLQGASCQGCAQAIGIDEAEWQRVGQLADAANEDGAFVAVRGFEWSSPTLGHMNVWFSRTWTDPLATGGIGATTTASFLLHEGNPPLDPAAEAQVNDLLRTGPEGSASMAGFYDWLQADPDRPQLGGGLDGIVGFNHPGREAGRFGYFAFDQRIADRVVSIEMFNRHEDYLFEGVPSAASPLVECLDSGWRVGILGVTDEHGTDWGQPEGKGRTGLWIPEGAFDRSAVLAAMRSRRFFATRERGLRLDATAGGVPMGSEVQPADGPLEIEVDLAKGDEWSNRTLRAQLLQTGRPLPTVAFEIDIVVPPPDAPPIRFAAPIDRDAGWLVLRITDPSQPADERAPAGSPYASAGRAIAYASPWYLREGSLPAPVLPVPTPNLHAAPLGLAGSTLLQRPSHHH